jgi:ectoine hydroxylase-related dioxygenase (phytanoyl-CoA dioxygenase family)
MEMTRPPAIEEEIRHFWEHGYLVVRNAFAPAEMAVVREVVDRHRDMRQHAEHAKAVSSGTTRPSFDTLFVWNDTAGNDVFAKVTRSHKVMDRLEAIFGDEVYVYHNKVALKYPGVVGFSYHQDYGYWYKMGNLFPDMASVFIAVDRATKENGCLRVVAGSHKLGRLDHVEHNGKSDSGVDPARLAQVLKVLPEVVLEMESGDIVFFHCNTLHASDDNRSNESRLALLGCFNTRHNDPYVTVHGHPNWHKQEKVLEPITAADIGNLPQFKRE